MFWAWLALNFMQYQQIRAQREDKMLALKRTLRRTHSKAKRKKLEAEIKKIRDAPYELDAGASALVDLSKRSYRGDD